MHDKAGHHAPAWQKGELQAGRGGGGGRVPVCHSMAAATTAEPTKGATLHKLLALATRTRQTQRKDVQQQLARGGQQEEGTGRGGGALAGVKCLAPPSSHEPSKHGKTDAPCQPPLQVEAGRRTSHNQDEDDDDDGTWRSQCSDMQTHARTTPAPPISPSPTLPLFLPPSTPTQQAVQARPEQTEEIIDSLHILYLHIVNVLYRFIACLLCYSMNFSHIIRSNRNAVKSLRYRAIKFYS